MEAYRKNLKQLEKTHAPSLLSKHGIICKQLDYGKDSACLYLAKPHWTNRFNPKGESIRGIFCCIWVSPEVLKRNQFAYNIHALGLYKMLGYKINSVKFADEFRSLIKKKTAKWPNISFDYGQRTLLEGRETADPGSFNKKVEQRINGFVSIHKHIDKLLDASSFAAKVK